MWTTLLMLFLASLSQVQTESVTILDQWQGGFRAFFNIEPDRTLHGWRIILVFDKPVDRVEPWNCEVVSHNATVWVVHNLNWDKDILVGQSQEVGFVAYWVDTKLERGSAQFYIENAGTITTRTTTRRTTPRTTTKTTTRTTTVKSTTSSTGSTTSTEPTTTTELPNSSNQGTGGSHMKYNYPAALKLSILFFNAQRSGKLPDDNPIPWREDSALSDGADVGIDLTGGWYDAGDNVKFNFPMAWSSWVLNWGFLLFQDAYDVLGLTDDMCDMIEWPLEYFLKTWRPDEYRLFVQVGNGKLDHDYWGRPEDMTMARPSYWINSTCPGSDVAAKTVSALASGYLVFKDICKKEKFADELLAAAESLFMFARVWHGKYTDCVKETAEFYESTDYNDELATAAAWLTKIQGEAHHSSAVNYYPEGEVWAFSWDDENVAAALLIYNLTKDSKYLKDIKAFLESYIGGDVRQTPCGLTYRDEWGPNSYAANAAFIALVAASMGIEPDRYKTYALSQINYMLGDNNLDLSYVIGLGNNYPKYPHHGGSSCVANTTCSIDDPDENPNLLVGGLVGGPDENDTYVDQRDDYVHNEVACDYNAGFQSAVAGLVHFAVNSLLPEPPEPKC